MIYQNISITIYMDISTEIILNLGKTALEKGWKKVQDSRDGFYTTILEKFRNFYTICLHNSNFIY